MVSQRPQGGRDAAAGGINRLVLVAGSAAIVALLSLAVIVASLAGIGGHSTIAIPATETPTATLTPTPTLHVLPTPLIGQFGAKALCSPDQLAATVYDPQTGQTLLAHNADRAHPIASTTKMMTALVVLFYGNNLDQKITITSAMYYNEIVPLKQASATVMGINGPGEQYTLRDLLYGLLLPSGDDAAVAIADGISGSETAFVARMNGLAHWLQLTQTSYSNPHGLDQIHHHNLSSAADLARLAQVAMYLPDFRRIVATPSYTIPANATHPALKLTSTNILLTAGKSLGIDGVKTGFTGCKDTDTGDLGAGDCVVLHALLGGHELYVVVLGDGAGNERFIDGAALVAWGFQEEGVTSAKAPFISLTPTPLP